MVDIISEERRSWNMSRIRGKDTKPEIIVRSMLHRMGYRFRLHRKDLPGKPDIVLTKYNTVIFVHGCFWHQHMGCKYAYKPKSRREFWEGKLRKNIERDSLHYEKLGKAGWLVLTIWECEAKDTDKLVKALHPLIELRGHKNERSATPT